MQKIGDGRMEIHATIYCEKASHKGVIIGKQGAMLKKDWLRSAWISSGFGLQSDAPLVGKGARVGATAQGI